MRIETPWTHLGHALRAEIGDDVWTGWQAPDGTYRLKSGGVGPGERDKAQAFTDWTGARKHAERAGNPTKGDASTAPLIAGAAIGGAMAALRGHLRANPGPSWRNPYAAAAHCGHTVARAIPASWMAGRGPSLGPDGRVTIYVRNGYRGAAEAALRRSGLMCPASVVESTHH